MGWGMGNLGGSSGGLNFKVVSGTTSPSNPRENTIWVNTDTDITSWIFSATEPETPVEGMVWISTGTTSTVEFNALKKNSIQVYPLSAKQYVSGAWVDVTAESYKDGAWVEWWNGEIFDNGNQFVNITGGWEFKKYSSVSSATVSVTDEAIIITGGSATSCVGTVDMDPNFIKDYSRIDFYTTVSNMQTGFATQWGIAPDYNLSSIDNEFSVKVMNQQNITGEQVISVDISTVDSGYVLFTAFKCTSKTTKIVLVK